MQICAMFESRCGDICTETDQVECWLSAGNIQVKRAPARLCKFLIKHLFSTNTCKCSFTNQCLSAQIHVPVLSLPHNSSIFVFITKFIFYYCRVLRHTLLSSESEV